MTIFSDNQNNFYRTFDIGCAAYLIVSNMDMIKFELEGTRACFIFPSEARNTSENFWNNTAKVEPRRLLSVLRDLKAELYNSNPNVK